jgi:hypothetical protein
MIQFKYLNGGNEDTVGFIPQFLNERDPRPAREQIDANYAHGGGWLPNPGFKLVSGPPHSIKYPGDPMLKPLAEAKLRDETIIVYESGITAIFQKDGSFEVSRLD